MNDKVYKKKALGPSNIVLNILIAVVIYLNAELSRAFGFIGLPLAISIIWTPSGISLASLLIFGRRIWPAIFFGNVLYNAQSFFSQAIYYDVVTIVLPFLISFGSLCESLFGFWVLRRFAPEEFLKTWRGVGVFLILAGLFSAFIGSSIGVSSLYFAGALPGELVWNVFFTFLVGDTLGIYFVTPILLYFYHAIVGNKPNNIS